jgi:hypothetical protein
MPASLKSRSGEKVQLCQRRPHIPRANERSVLQKLPLTRGLSLQQRYPAGRLLISNMVAKDWIEKQLDGRTYRRTPEGKQAMKIILKI